MRLNDLLKICLRAVASRYPHCVVEIDQTLLTFLLQHPQTEPSDKENLILPDASAEMSNTNRMMLDVSSSFAPGTWEEDCSAERALQLLQRYAPDLLEIPARVVIGTRQPESIIYIVDQYGERPAFRLYCGDSLRIEHRKRALHEYSEGVPLVITHE